VIAVLILILVAAMKKLVLLLKKRKKRSSIEIIIVKNAAMIISNMIMLKILTKSKNIDNLGKMFAIICKILISYLSQQEFKKDFLMLPM